MTKINEAKTGWRTKGEEGEARNSKKKARLAALCPISLIKKSSIAETDVERKTSSDAFSLPGLFHACVEYEFADIGGVWGDERRPKKRTQRNRVGCGEIGTQTSGRRHEQKGKRDAN